MHRRDLASQVGKKLDVPAVTVAHVLETALGLLIDELIQTGRLEWRGLGTFTVRTYGARQIHNPATGKTIRLKERKFVTYKPGQRIRARLVSRGGHTTARTQSRKIITKLAIQRNRDGRRRERGQSGESMKRNRSLMLRKRRHP
jgi:nucleoid DNA-binding protein